MPHRNAKARGRRPNRQNKRAPIRGNRRATPSNHTTSIVDLTLQLKQAHKKEEVYPLSLDKLISRANVGNDAEIRLIGYTMSVALATGNDCSTVSLNIGHSGPWIRRGDSTTDTFNQVCTEHTIRGKSVLFKKKVVATSEREYINPDKLVNSVDLRVRDPCGVIPGVVARIQFRAHIIRRVPQSTFLNGNESATDRYEDQDVSSGSNPNPLPPSAIKHAPAIIDHTVRYGNKAYTDGIPVNGKLEYKEDGSSSISYYISVTSPAQAISGIYSFSTSVPDQTDYNSAGFDGNITQ